MNDSNCPELSGLLLVDKPSGPTTYDLIRQIKRKIGKVKIGHCGTLDPLASGLVLLLFGRARKLQDQFMKSDKTYRCHFKLGVKTDTGDVTGKIIQTAETPALSRGKLESILGSFVGTREQIPPMFSALKHQGVPLYKLARKGEVVERKPRNVTIRSMDLLDFKSKIINEIENRFLPFLKEGQIELVDVTFQKEQGGWALCFFIDKEGGITLDDCAVWSDRIGVELDRMDIIPYGYNLEVSSPGIYRPLKQLDDFKRFVGSRIHVKLYAPLDGAKNFTGILLDADEGFIRIKLEGEEREVSLPRDQVAKAHLDPKIEI